MSTSGHSQSISNLPTETKLRNNDTLSWLKRHSSKPNFAATHFGKEDRRVKIGDWLLDGLSSEKDSKEVLINNLLFTSKQENISPEDWSNPQISLSSASLEDAIQVIRNYEETIRCKNTKGNKNIRNSSSRRLSRIEQGLNPSTIITEYRRKIILQALLDTGDTNESRSQTIKKLNNHLDFDAKSKERTLAAATNSNKTQLDTISNVTSFSNSNKNPININNININNTNKSNNNIDTDTETEFQAKWANYDVMRTRWKYILPQVRELVVDEGHMIAPASAATTALTFLVLVPQDTSTSPSTGPDRVGDGARDRVGEPVAGTYRDIDAFIKMKERKSFRQQSQRLRNALINDSNDNNDKLTGIYSNNNSTTYGSNAYTYTYTNINTNTNTSADSKSKINFN